MRFDPLKSLASEWLFFFVAPFKRPTALGFWSKIPPLTLNPNVRDEPSQASPSSRVEQGCLLWTDNCRVRCFLLFELEPLDMARTLKKRKGTGTRLR